MRQQQVKRRRTEFQQRLVRAHRIVLDVDRAQDAAVAVPEFWRLQQAQAVGDRIETVTAIRVAPVPPGRIGVPVQADACPDPQALDRGKHRTVQESAVGLDGHVHLGGHAGTERADKAGQPFRPRKQRLAAVQDDVDAGKVVTFRVLGDTVDGLAGHRHGHSLGQPPPALIGHFIDIAIGARQIAAAVYFQDKLLERNSLMPCCPDHRHVKVEQRPPSGMLGFLSGCHSNQAAKSSGLTLIPLATRRTCISNRSGRWMVNTGRDGIAGSRLMASARPIQAAGSGSAARPSR